MSKERAKRYRQNHPEAWAETAQRIAFKATIRLYKDKTSDADLLATLEAERQEGESDRALLLRMLHKALGK